MPAGGDLDGPWDDDDDLAGDDLTPAEILALEEADGVWDDPAWLEELYAEEVSPEEAEAPAGEPEPSILDAGFTHGEPGAPGCGLESGGVLDRMLPGRDLAARTGMARAAGMGQLSDDELIGFMCAARRNTSWQQALELVAVAELDRRRARPGGCPGEHVAEEVAAALKLTPRAADWLLGLAEGISRLSQVPAALAAGVIDARRAEVFARELMVVDDELAVQAEALVMPRAADLTTGQLTAALQRAVLAVDAGAAERRKERAEKEGRVEAWTEPGRGTAALAGRDLPAAGVIAADKRITAAARWLRAHGARGGTDWLRSRAYLGFLSGYSLDDLLAHLLAQPVGDQDHDDTGHSDDDAARAGNGAAEGTGRDEASEGSTDGSCAAGGPGSSQDGLSGSGSSEPGSASTRSPGAGSNEPPGTGTLRGSGGGSPADGSDPEARAGIPPGLASPPVPPGLGALAGSVNLVMSALAWLGLTDAPGEITGTPAGGPADATTCRDLATALATRHDTRWCLTLTGPDGRAVAHGCARRGPPPPRQDLLGGPGPPGRAGPSPPDPLGWLRSVPLNAVERDECAHRLEVPGYRPSPRLRHQIRTRSPRCSFPGCRRPAAACDDDHTLAWHQGGRTCECNLAPLCRRHHRAKQAPGWQLTQPRPGTLVWTLPSGRSYTTEPEPYPGWP
jgi:hypothetical protein